MKRKAPAKVCGSGEEEARGAQARGFSENEGGSERRGRSERRGGGKAREGEENGTISKSFWRPCPRHDPKDMEQENSGGAQGALGGINMPRDALLEKVPGQEEVILAPTWRKLISVGGYRNPWTFQSMNCN